MDRVRYLEDLVEAGDISAYGRLASLYRFGLWGVEIDPVKSSEWEAKATKQEQEND